MTRGKNTTLLDSTKHILGTYQVYLCFICVTYLLDTLYFWIVYAARAVATCRYYLQAKNYYRTASILNGIWHSWIKRDQLDVTCFLISLLTAQHVSDVNTSILRSLRRICCVISCVVLLCYDVVCSGMMWYPDVGFSLHPDTTPPQPNHKVTPTHIEPEQYNPWNNSTNKSQAPEDECINIRNMLSIK